MRRVYRRLMGAKAKSSGICSGAFASFGQVALVAAAADQPSADRLNASVSPEPLS